MFQGYYNHLPTMQMAGFTVESNYKDAQDVKEQDSVVNICMREHVRDMLTLYLPPEHKLYHSRHVSRRVFCFTCCDAQALRTAIYKMRKYKMRKIANQRRVRQELRPTCKASCNEHFGKSTKPPNKRGTWYTPVASANIPVFTIHTDVDENSYEDENDDGDHFQRSKPVFCENVGLFKLKRRTDSSGYLPSSPYAFT
jgi:hypothetical protein